MTAKITKVLGSEHDQRLRDALSEALAELGGTSRQLLFGVAGSQEVESVEVAMQGRKVIVEAETYAGVSVSGDEDQVLAIASAVERRMRPPTATIVATRFGWSFRSPLSLPEMSKRLDAVLERPLSRGDSEYYGDYLGAKLAEGTVARIYETDGHFVVNLAYRSLDGDAAAANARIAEGKSRLFEKILPAVLAAEVAETEPLD